MSEWQPIETAPKDGAAILLYFEARACVAVWDFGDEEWIYAITNEPDNISYCSYANNPTHWMPLPEPPK